MSEKLNLQRSCERCWNNAWVPVPSDDPDAQEITAGPLAGSFARCDHCWLGDQLLSARDRIEVLEAMVTVLADALGRISDIEDPADGPTGEEIEIARRIADEVLDKLNPPKPKPKPGEMLMRKEARARRLTKEAK